MKYTHNSIILAEAEVAERRKKALDLAEEREKYICEQLPEVKMMKAQLANSYRELVKIVANRPPNSAELAKTVKDKNLETQKRIRILVEGLTGDPKFMEPRFVCTKCSDTGIVEGERCECLLELMKNYTIKELNAKFTITLHDFSEFDISYYQDEEARSKMRLWLDHLTQFCINFPEDRRSILMFGGTGLGKTFLSSCVAKALAERGCEAAFGSAFNFLRRIEDEQFGRAEGSTIDSLIDAELLIIDDLGSEQPKQVYEIYLYNIINSRVNLSRPTIISTNLQPKQIEQRYHERIASRLMGAFLPMHFFGSDIRQQKMARRINKN